MFERDIFIHRALHQFMKGLLNSKTKENAATISRTGKMQKSRRSGNVDLRIPTEDEILENPKRAKFIGGGWVDSLDTNTINLYWHKHQDHFTIYSLLQVLEHETLHVVLAKIVDFETSEKLDNIHRSSYIRLSNGKPVFINQILIEKWSFPPYLEKPIDISSNHNPITEI